MSEYKRKLDRAERLPLWPSIEFQSSCPFLSSVKSKYSQTDWTKWDKQSPSRGSCHSKRNMAAWRCPGRAPSATVLQVILFGGGGGEEAEKRERREEPITPTSTETSLMLLLQNCIHSTGSLAISFLVKMRNGSEVLFFFAFYS